MIDSSYLLVCAIAFVAMFGGGLIGILAARALPEHHLSAQSATVVKLAAAVVVSLTSLVLALMLSSANSSYSANAGIVKKLSSDLIHLDHLLRVYATKKNDELFGVSKAPSTTSSETANRETADQLDALLDAVVSLSPADRRQTALVSQAQFLIDNVYAERWLLWENPGSTVPAQFLFVLIFWLG